MLRNRVIISYCSRLQNSPSTIVKCNNAKWKIQQTTSGICCHFLILSLTDIRPCRFWQGWTLKGLPVLLLPVMLYSAESFLSSVSRPIQEGIEVSVTLESRQHDGEGAVSHFEQTSLMTLGRRVTEMYWACVELTLAKAEALVCLMRHPMADFPFAGKKCCAWDNNVIADCLTSRTQVINAQAEARLQVLSISMQCTTNWVQPICFYPATVGQK